MQKRDGYIILSGPFRFFESAADAQEAAEGDCDGSNQAHVIVPVTLTDKSDEEGEAPEAPPPAPKPTAKAKAKGK